MAKKEAPIKTTIIKLHRSSNPSRHPEARSSKRTRRPRHSSHRSSRVVPEATRKVDAPRKAPKSKKSYISAMFATRSFHRGTKSCNTLIRRATREP